MKHLLTKQFIKSHIRPFGRGVFVLICTMLLFAPTSVYARPGDSDVSFGANGIVTHRIDISTSVQPLATASALQQDGKIVFAGVGITVVNGSQTDRIVVIRYNENGSLDTTFGTNGIFSVSSGFFEDVVALAIQPDGKILIGGDRYLSPTNTDFLVIRLNPDGTPDNSFDSNGVAVANVSGGSNEIAGDMVLQSDGKILIVGQTDNQTNYTNMDWAMARFNSDGSLDTSFSSAGVKTISILGDSENLRSVVRQPDGRIVTCGVTSNGFDDDLTLARFLANSSLDTSFGTNGIVLTTVGAANEYCSSLRLLSNGNFLAGGRTDAGAGSGMLLARYLPNGALDPGFGVNGILMPSGFGSYAYDLSIQSDQKILTAGRSGPNVILGRFSADGLPDSTFGIGGRSSVSILIGSSVSPSTMFLQPDGKVVVSGTATYPGTGNPSMDFFVSRFLGGTSTRAPFDFDGDSKTDISIYRPSVGEWWYLRSIDGGNRAFQFGSTTDMITPGDYTGDGKTDVGFWRPSTGEWYILRSEDGSYYSFPFGSTGDVPVPSDYDGDGKTDTAVFRPSNNTWYILNSHDLSVTFTTFGAAGDKPVPADYDGDGKSDVAIYRPGPGEWWYLRSIDGGNRAFQFGNSTDKPVQGDFTGDGKADIAFYRPSSGEWYILRSNDGSYYSFPFGLSTDIPAPGDYDGDGKIDATVYRPSSNTWFSNTETAGVIITTFGSLGDKPVPGAYVP